MAHLRLSTLTTLTRLYHNSKFERLPTIKYANTRIKNTKEKIANSAAKPRIDRTYEVKKFEPYPFAITESNKHEVIRKLLVPLFDVKYEDQLEMKESHCRQALRTIAQTLYSSGNPVRLDVRRLPCHVTPIVRAKQLDRYRCKDDFSVWRGVDETKNVVGYMAFPLGKHGDTVCVEPDSCDTMSELSIKMSHIASEFLNSNAKFPVSFTLEKEGGWRRFRLCINDKNQLMFIGTVNPRFFKVQEVVDEMENFRSFMVTKIAEAGIDLHSLYFEACPHGSCDHNLDVPMDLLHGQDKLPANFANIKVLIGPQSYIPDSLTNTEVYLESLDSTIEESFEMKGSALKPLVLNVNSGIGIEAVHLSKLARKLVCIDRNPIAMEDCRVNVALNKIQHVDFLNCNTEIAIEKVLNSQPMGRDEEILVVCNQQKLPMHSHGIDAIKNCKKVKKVVFISSNIHNQSIMDNVVKLCSKDKRKSGKPFTLVRATPVDTSPGVKTFTTILTLQRLEE